MTRLAAIGSGALAGVGAFNVTAWLASVNPWLGVVALVIMSAIAVAYVKSTG